MGSVNEITLVGNLGRDAEMRFTAGGTPVSTVSLATSEKWTDKDGQKHESTQWHRLVIWGKQAQSLQEYLTKGKQIYVKGKVEYREWTDKEGKPAKTTEIRVFHVVLLGGARSDGGGANGGGTRRRASRQAGDDPDAPDTQDAPAQDMPPDEDIPF